jgi:hypothetical protein
LRTAIKRKERSSDIRSTTRGLCDTGKYTISCHSLQSPWIEVRLNKVSSPAALLISWFFFWMIKYRTSSIFSNFSTLYTSLRQKVKLEFVSKKK